MEELGQLLKSEREKRGLSLHEIGMSLKINPKILKAIEDNDSANLPAKTFLRGFVRSYAQYLRLDVEHALKLFQAEYGTTRPEDVPAANVTSSPSSEAPPVQQTTAPRYEKPLKKSDDIALPRSSGGRWIQIILAIFILMTIAFVVKMIDKYQKESEIEALPATTPIESSTTTLPESTDANLSTPISTTTIPAVGMSVASSSTTNTTVAAVTTTILPITTTTLKPTTTTTISTTTTLRPTTTTSTTTTTVKPTTTSTTLKAAVVSTSTTTSSSSTTTTLVNKNVEVIVEALNTVQISYILGDEAKKSMELKPDQIHTFKSKNKVQLEVSDGGAINVIVNGRDRGVPGTIGKSLKLTFP